MIAARWVVLEMLIVAIIGAVASAVVLVGDRAARWAKQRRENRRKDAENGK